jgi:hypothetical protein
VGAQVELISLAWLLQSFHRNCRKWAVLDRWTCWRVSVCVCVYMYICVCACISNMDLPLLSLKCSECPVRGISNHFVVTEDKRPCVLDGLAGPILCVCDCVCVYI